jgi:hypothetical protein
VLEEVQVGGVAGGGAGGVLIRQAAQSVRVFETVVPSE